MTELLASVDIVYVGLFIVGLGGAFIGALCGGGMGMVVLPALIVMGLSPVTAVATMTAAALGDSLGGLARFIKSDALYKKHMLSIAICASVGAMLGIRILVSVDEDILLRVVGLLLLCLLPILFLSPPDQAKEKSITMKRIGFAGLLATGVYTTFFGANAGFFLIYCMISFFGYPIVRAHAMTKFFFLIVNITAFPILLSQGLIHIPYVLMLFVGMILGSYAGAHMMLSINPRYVKMLMAVMISIVAVRILFFS